MTPSGGTWVVFEAFSAAHVIGARRAVRSARGIIISRRTPFEDSDPAERRRALRWARRLNPSVEIKELSIDDVLDYLPLNRAAIDQVAALAPAIIATPAYQRLRRVIRDDRLVRYFQAAIVRSAANWRLFPAVCARLAEAMPIVAVPDWETAAHCRDAPPNAGARWRRGVRVVKARWAAVAVPLVLTARAVRQGWVSTPSGPFAAAMPVVWGMSDPAVSQPVVRPHQDDYLYGRLRPGQIMHLFGDWSFPLPAQQAFTKAFCARGCAVADKARFAFGPRLRRAAVRALAAMVPGVWQPSHGWLDDLVVLHTPKALYHYLRKQRERDNVTAGVELVRDDYNPGHVVAGLASHEHGVKTVAVQHNALPYEAPQLAFVTADYLASYGEFYRAGFAPHWDGVNVRMTGRESLDWTLNAARADGASAGARERWRQHRPGGRPMVLVVFPGDRDICIVPQWDALCDGLRRFATANPGTDIVLRFRHRESLRSPHVAQFTQLSETLPNCVTVWSEFTTYELMSLADVVVSHDGSFTVNEAIALGRPTFSFEFVCAGRYYFGTRYGTDFVLTTADDLMRVLTAHAAGAPVDCDWGGLARDLNAHTDGRNQSRLRAVVEEAAGMPPAGVAS
ncbi:MAG: hypothetical protein FJW21_12465 [Acidimicrobiia bacterium]|nr:hypothetical protein [Acidimicrobiia bacterium]